VCSIYGLALITASVVLALRSVCDQGYMVSQGLAAFTVIACSLWRCCSKESFNKEQTRTGVSIFLSFCVSWAVCTILTSVIEIKENDLSYVLRTYVVPALEFLICLFALIPLFMNPIDVDALKNIIASTNKDSAAQGDDGPPPLPIIPTPPRLDLLAELERVETELMGKEISVIMHSMLPGSRPQSVRLNKDKVNLDELESNDNIFDHVFKRFSIRNVRNSGMHTPYYRRSTSGITASTDVDKV
jgi:hypothetical protein